MMLFQNFTHRFQRSSSSSRKVFRIFWHFVTDITKRGSGNSGLSIVQYVLTGFGFRRDNIFSPDTTRVNLLVDSLTKFYKVTSYNFLGGLKSGIRVKERYALIFAL